MDTNLQGRLKNLTLPKKSGLIPLFEAIVNSIHAIEDRFSTPTEVSKFGRIDIFIRRDDSQRSLDLNPGRKPEKAITGFDVVDNGTGFTAKNWNSFNKLDFTEKADKGCRGVGRLTWLKAFEDVHIDSTFSEGGEEHRRMFRFSRDEEVSGGDLMPDQDRQETTHVSLRNFRSQYAASVEKTGEAIAARVLEHALWYFVRSGGVPRMVVHDDQVDAPIELNDLYDEHMHAESAHEDFEVKGVPFNITHVKFRMRQDRRHVLAYCAGQRLVLEEQLELAGLSASVSDQEGPYRYAGYIVSSFLDEKVLSERTGFDLGEEADGLLADMEITRNDIREAVRPLAARFLGDSLQENIRAGKERLDSFITNTAPQYFPIVKLLGDDEMFVDPAMSDAQLDRTLHAKKYQVEQTLLEEGSNLLRPSLSDDIESYSERIADYMDRLQSVKQSDLAAYVTHRRVVLDLLKSALEINDDGSFDRESVVHNLIMPVGSTSEDLRHLRASNLWLLDERLAFHQHYLGSDKSLASTPITDASGGKEPDILSLNIYDNPHAFSDRTSLNQATITIVEIKKPMRKGYGAGEDKDPIEQALGYLRRIREGGVMTKTGRHLPRASELPGYIYVLADLTDSMRRRCEYASLNEAPDGMSYFGWNGNPKIKAYIEVIDFSGLLDAATQRNSAFFDHLGLPNGRND